MSDPFHIIGAGAAGLLAGAILRDECAQIHEAAAGIPHNHSAVLRFRSPIVGDALNIPFKRVDVIKATVPYAGNPIGDALAYSTKATGSAMLRSIASAKGEVEERWVAPSDFVERMAAKVTAQIAFNCPWHPDTFATSDPRISTMPMPALAAILGYAGLPVFSAVHGFTLRCKLFAVQAHASLYLPSPLFNAYRASIHGDELIIEFAEPGMLPSKVQEIVNSFDPEKMDGQVGAILRAFGLPPEAADTSTFAIKTQRYTKILPIDNDARERFILWASEVHNIYSLGRFATWRPGLLLDDVVNDVRVIQRIASGSSYSRRKAHASG